MGGYLGLEAFGEVSADESASSGDTDADLLVLVR